MRIRLLSFCSALVTCGLLAPAIFVGPSQAQTNKLVWDKDVGVVKRVVKPGRKPAPRRRPVMQAPLLTVQYRLIKRGEGGRFIDTSPSTVFYTGDQVKIAVTPNQDGYLYIIHNAQGRDGQVVFPDSRINDGTNFVRKNTEYVVPGSCPKFLNPKDCWYEMDAVAGREEFTVIFSRDAISSLPNLAIGNGGVVKHDVIREIRSQSSQDIEETSLRKGIGEGNYVIWIKNKNKKDNEELIHTIGLSHRAEQSN
ncbi:MAG TPA: DUF4384 domain-containing protein [Blastocatellia bacterium]|jgi:hypothetical protein|nr:DUF4384 domain-containing protein [Blastocatellia bacterium]